MTPLVIAHRGVSGDEPENSLPAFRRAIEVGADYVEFDVRRTRDGELVVAHDPVRRPLAALRERKPHVPTLREVVATCAGQIGLAVELKEPGLEREVLAELAAHDVDPDSTMIVSFLPAAIRETRRLRPDLRTVQHVARVSIRRAAGYAWAAGFADGRATARRLALARSLGLATTVYTVNEPRRMRELAAPGVDAIFTDRPVLLRRLLEEQGAHDRG